MKSFSCIGIVCFKFRSKLGNMNFACDLFDAFYMTVSDHRASSLLGHFTATCSIAHSRGLIVAPGDPAMSTTVHIMRSRVPPFPMIQSASRHLTLICSLLAEGEGNLLLASYPCSLQEHLQIYGIVNIGELVFHTFALNCITHENSFNWSHFQNIFAFAQLSDRVESHILRHLTSMLAKFRCDVL